MGAVVADPHAELPQQAVSAGAWACGAKGFRAFWFVMKTIGNPEAGVESNDKFLHFVLAAS
jgi:hypothetical protein